MFDFIIDYSNICWGIVGEVNEDTIAIPAHEWAPGIWAGSEGCDVKIKDRVFTIVSVDLENKTFRVCPHPDDSDLVGAEIYPKVD